MTTTIDFNTDWKFKKGDDSVATKNDISDDEWDKITLPHCYNAEDIQSKASESNLIGFRGKTTGKKEYGYYRGITWYRKSFTFAENINTKRIFLKFGAVSTIADVYVNEKHIVKHTNAFSAFTIEITEFLNPFGQENIIAVKVDNSKYSNLPPLSGDFPIMGGIYRPVELLLKEKSCISPLDYGTEGIYISQTQVSKTNAKLEYKILLLNSELERNNFTIKTTVLDMDGNSVGQVTETVKSIKKDFTVSLLLEIENPHLWHGRKDPYLYTSCTRLVHKSEVLDEINISIGIRDIKFDPKKGFFLNGEPYFMSGVAKHQDKFGKGWALTKEDLELDHNIMYDLGIRALRLSHYQHPSYIYDLCDKSGILIWTEIPVVNTVSFDDEFLENATEALKALIRQNYNHPSVFLWGLFNEIGMFQVKDPSPVIEKLNELAHKEDPYRLTTSAAISFSTIRKRLHRITDVLAINTYPGWYFGKPEDMTKFIRSYFKLRKKEKIGVSEYGAGGALSHHDQDPKKVNTKGQWHPEEWQTRVHEITYPLIRNSTQTWGSFIWNMFDFAVPFRNEGDTPGLNDKGLVTYNRKTKKDVYFYYKAQWSDEPFIHLGSKRHVNRTEKSTPVRVYANQKKIFLWLNQEFIGEIPQVAPGCFQIDDISLAQGENHIRVGDSKECTGLIDECIWVLLS